jgi:hypothetical protein
VLHKLSERVADCHCCARQARDGAEHAPEVEKLDHLALERAWLMLAESYQLLARIGDIGGAANEPIAAVLSRQSAAVTARVPCPVCGKDMRKTDQPRSGSNTRAGRYYFKCETCEVAALWSERSTGDGISPFRRC